MKSLNDSSWKVSETCFKIALITEAFVTTDREWFDCSHIESSTTQCRMVKKYIILFAWLFAFWLSLRDEERFSCHPSESSRAVSHRFLTRAHSSNNRHRMDCTEYDVCRSSSKLPSSAKCCPLRRHLSSRLLELVISPVGSGRTIIEHGCILLHIHHQNAGSHLSRWGRRLRRMGNRETGPICVIEGWLAQPLCLTSGHLASEIIWQGSKASSVHSE